MQKVYVAGVGMTEFRKPGNHDVDYPDMVRAAGTAALADAKTMFAEVDQVVVGYCYGESTSGQRAVYELGMTGIPILNVNNNCATGSSALFVGHQLVSSGLADCVLVVGFEKMQRGSLSFGSDDRSGPLDNHLDLIKTKGVTDAAPAAAQLFGNAGIEHMKMYGTTVEQFAKVAQKNHAHSVNNPYAQFQREYTLAEIMDSPTVFGPLTRLQCCPTSDGAAVVVLANERFVRNKGLSARAVGIEAISMRTDTASAFDGSMIEMVGAGMTRATAQDVYSRAGITPDDLDVVELHDCFSANELITYEALDLCPVGQGGAYIESGAATYGGKLVINPSGGLISKGHPLGATGLAQCSEITWQLRGDAAARQVVGARVGLQHNIGLGGAAVVAVYSAPGVTV